MSEVIEKQLVRRYYSKVEEICYDDFGDEPGSPDEVNRIWIDRLKDEVVIRYDLIDPANHNEAYGAPSDDERFERKGLNKLEEVELKDCKHPTSASEVNWLRRFKEREAKREEEEKTSKNLWDILSKEFGDKVTPIDSRNYVEVELNEIDPELERLGYTVGVWISTDKDSFGPLVRQMRATDKDGNVQVIYYG